MAARIEVPDGDLPKVISANFTNGRLKHDAAGMVKMGLFCNTEDKDPQKKSQKILVTEAGKHSYIGKNFGPTAPKFQHLCKYYVGVLNKETGKMRICDVEMFNMHPYTKSEDKPKKLVFKEDQEESFYVKQRKLIEAFGHAKGKCMIDAREKFVVNESSFESAITSAVETAKRDDDSLLTRAVPENTQLTMKAPPCNRNAEVIQDVYPLTNIISPAEMDILTTPAKKMFDATKEQIREWEFNKSYPVFVIEHLLCLPVIEEDKWEEVKCLFYMNYLMQLYQVKRSTMEEHRLLSNVPPVIRNALLNRFTLVTDDGKGGQVKKRYIPSWMRDKLIMYILVLALIIDKFQTDLRPLQVDLQLGQKRLSTIFRTLGCRIHRKKNPEIGGICMAGLLFPLLIPSQTQILRRPKRKR